MLSCQYYNIFSSSFKGWFLRHQLKEKTRGCILSRPRANTDLPGLAPPTPVMGEDDEEPGRARTQTVQSTCLDPEWSVHLLLKQDINIMS